jgi:hypothetical protein
MNAETMRKNAENCRALAEDAREQPVRLRYLRMAEAWKMLADNKNWLDGALVSDHTPLQPELNSAA